MSPGRIPRPIIAGLVFISLTAMGTGPAHGQKRLLVKKELVWSQPESDIGSPHFTDDGNFIVLVSRVHWPDAHEAEDVPESFLDQLENRRQKDPRFADPVIKLIDLKGNSVCEVRYGSNPSVSADGKSIAFSHQKRPLSGLRLGAATLAGNDIQIFDCEKKEARTIAEPESGYLDDPVFLPDGKSIAYTRNEAVNGAYGGAVGLDRVDLAGTQKETLIARKTTPAVPCPPAGSVNATLAYPLCSQQVKLTSAFPDLLTGLAMADSQLLVLQGKPIPTAGDLYMASQYAISIETVLPQMNVVLSLGQAQDPSEISLQPASEARVMIFWEYWRPYSLPTKNWLPDARLRNKNRSSIYSPDLRYYLAAEPPGTPDHFTLYQARDGKKVLMLPGAAQVYGAVWSRDSKRFAVVVVPRGVSGATYREELVVYSIP